MVPWIHKKDAGNVPIDPLDIIRFLELHHVQKLDVSNFLPIPFLEVLSSFFLIWSLYPRLDSFYCYVSEGGVLKPIEKSAT